MKEQHHSNYRRYYPPHHFVFYPILLVLLIISIYYISRYPDDASWKLIAALVLLLAWLSFMLRQHYALTLQNRIIRLELRLRYFQLTGKRLEKIEPLLTFRQLASIRFASDEELPALIERTLKENLRSSEIIKSIEKWNADHMRV